MQFGYICEKTPNHFLMFAFQVPLSFLSYFASQTIIVEILFL